MAVQARPLVVPFTMDQSRIVVEVNLNGRDGFPFILDTGMTGRHLLTDETTSLLGLATSSGGHGYDSAGRRFDLQQAVLPSLTVGELLLLEESVAVLALPPAAIAMEAGRRLAGVLGDPLLRGFAVTLDFETKRMELFPGSPPPVSGDTGTVVLPLDWSGNVLTSTVRINGRPELVMVDTGDFHTLTLYEDAAARLGVAPAGEETHLPVLGAAGPYLLKTAMLDRVDLGQYRLRDLPAAISPRGEAMPAQIGGRLGIGLLSRFKVTLDTAGRRLLLTPRSDQVILAEGPLPERQASEQ